MKGLRAGATLAGVETPRGGAHDSAEATTDGGTRFSVVVPTLDEAQALPALLSDLRALPAMELIVADGGSSDGTREIASSFGATVITGSRGRGAQLRAGAAAAHGDILCFLHADARLDARACEALASLVHGWRDDGTAWAFRLRILGRGPAFRVVERGANLRSRLGLPYGDQGLIVSRALYERAGGFPDVPLMEDVSLIRAIARHGRVRLLRASIGVSARRWERDGVMRRSIRNLVLLLRWYAGASPSDLAREYERSAGRG